MHCSDSNILATSIFFCVTRKLTLRIVQRSTHENFLYSSVPKFANSICVNYIKYIFAVLNNVVITVVY